jgi:hypothetical protein
VSGWVPTFRLEAPGVETLLLNEATNNLDVYDSDFGFPEVRTVVEAAPDADGTVDTTALIGARTVTLRLWLDSVPWATRQRLVRFLHPKLRPTLFFRLDEDQPEMRVDLRGDLLSGNLPTLMQLADQRDVMVQWVAPSGVLESADLYTVIATTGGAGAEVGRLYDLVYPRLYPASPVLGAATCTNAGTADAYPLIRIYGPCTDPVVTNDTAGRSLEFSGLTIDAGQFLEVDTRARTIRYNADPADSRYSKLVFPTSRWWTLAPGTNQVRFVPATGSGGASADIVFRDTYL